MIRLHCCSIAGRSTEAGGESTQAKPKSISLVLAPSNLGLRPTESGGEPGAWRASQALMDAGLARALDVEETARLEKLVGAIQ